MVMANHPHPHTHHMAHRPSLHQKDKTHILVGFILPPKQQNILT